MKHQIFKNLFLSVDYEKEKTPAGIYTGRTIFYLIGRLPILIIYPNQFKEITQFKVKEEIPIGDPHLRNMLGARATDDRNNKRYKNEIQKIVQRLEKVITSALKAQKFKNKPFSQFKIINVT